MDYPDIFNNFYNIQFLIKSLFSFFKENFQFIVSRKFKQKKNFLKETNFNISMLFWVRFEVEKFINGFEFVILDLISLN